jgi:nitrate reductase gamma subunit
MSTPDDYILLLFLILIAGLGVYQVAIEMIFGISFLAGPWIASIFKLQPDISGIVGAPLINKLHIIIAFYFLAIFLLLNWSILQVTHLDMSTDRMFQ